MAVAARGLRKDTFAERRYHHPSMEGGFLANGQLIWLNIPPVSTKHHPIDIRSFPQATPSPAEIKIPSPALSRQGTTDGEMISRNYFAGLTDSPDESLNAQPTTVDTIATSKPRSPTPSSSTEQKHRIHSRNTSTTTPLPSLSYPLQSHKHPHAADKERQPLTAEIKKRNVLGKSRSRSSRRNADGYSDEEIGLHEWENRGDLVLEVP